MGAIVFTSAGSRKYHFAKDCTAFHSAQLLSDLDCGCDTYCTHRMPRMHGLQRMSAAKAAMDGKLPCLACTPQHLRELPEVDSFGHEPMWADFGQCVVDPGACNCPYHDERQACARCRHGRQPVEWPCMSAVILGLAPRPCPHCNGHKSDPDDPGDWISEVGMHNPYSSAPCPECHGSGLATSKAAAA